MVKQLLSQFHISYLYNARRAVIRRCTVVFVPHLLALFSLSLLTYTLRHTQIPCADSNVLPLELSTCCGHAPPSLLKHCYWTGCLCLRVVVETRWLGTVLAHERAGGWRSTASTAKRHKASSVLLLRSVGVFVCQGVRTPGKHCGNLALGLIWN